MEVEIRAKTDDLNIVKERLLETGATEIGSELQIDEYFRHKSFDDNAHFVFRIRKTEEKSFFTFKALNKEHDTGWHEFEFETENPATIKRTLINSDFESFLTINKHRQKFIFKNFEINLDKIGELGDFIEVELISDDVEDSKRKIKLFLLSLGIEEENMVEKGYVKLMLERH